MSDDNGGGGNGGGDDKNKRRRRGRRRGGRGRGRGRGGNKGRGDDDKRKKKSQNANQQGGDGGNEGGGKNRGRRRRRRRGGRGRGRKKKEQQNPNQQGGGDAKQQKKGGGRRRRSRRNKRRSRRGGDKRDRRQRKREPKDDDRNPAPIRVEDGLKVAQKGQIGKAWWSRKWVGSLERFGWKNRMARGREYARSGQVLGFHVVPGTVVARIQGTRPKPYETAIKLRQLESDEWDRVLDAMSASAGFAAHLLAGEMPREVEKVFKRADAPLFPEPGADMETLCSCPDPANPCKHVAALHYVLADALDKDPFILLKLRGRTREDVTEALRERRAAAAQIGDEADEEEAEIEPEETLLTEPLPRDPARFWRYGTDFPELRVRPQAVETPHALATRLGAPDSWPDTVEYEEMMREGYAAASRRALEIAFGPLDDEDEDDDDENDE